MRSMNKRPDEFKAFVDRLLVDRKRRSSSFHNEIGGKKGRVIVEGTICSCCQSITYWILLLSLLT